MGAGKAGTSTLWEHLREHPEAVLCSQKEPKFFSTMPGLAATGARVSARRAGTADQGWAWYLSLFGLDAADERSPGLRYGEASTRYLIDPESPRLIAQANPDIRLVVTLRDPVDRLHSQYWQVVKSHGVQASFSDMNRLRGPDFLEWMSHSRYSVNLDRYLEYFDSDQILAIAFDDIKSQPTQTLQRLYAHIGVDPNLGESTINRTYNAARQPRSRWVQANILANHRILAFGKKLPVPARAAGRSLRGVLTRANRRTPRPYSALDPGIRTDLVAEFEADILAAEAFIGRRLDSWRS